MAVLHLNKNTALQVLYRVSGSMSFLAQARASWVVAYDSEVEGRRLFMPLKCNLSINPNALAFRLKENEAVFEEAPVSVRADDVLMEREESPREEAKRFLRETLSDGEKSAAEDNNPSWQRFVCLNRGIAYVEKNEIKEARKATNELKNLLAQELNKKLLRDYYFLVGLIELKEKNHSVAIENLNKSLSLYPYHQGSNHILFFDSLALVYFKSGELDKAQEFYEKITQLTEPRYSYGDIYAKSFYMLGKISEQKGLKEKAIENYEKFLEFRKNADPGFKEVEDARKSLTELQKSP